MSNISLDFSRTPSDSVLMDRVAPSTIRYIKLGAGGRWEATSLDQGRLQWGLASDPHEPAAIGDWQALNQAYRDADVIASTATGYTNEARAFYDADPRALWITFARGRMWWAYAEAEVHWTGGDCAREGTRYRIAPGGWRDTDADGEPLTIDRLSTKLTQLASYQRTICGLSSEQQALCLRYINVEADAELQAVVDAQAALRTSLTVLVRRLTWSDFELLVELAVGRGGWVRVSSLGGAGKDVDLTVEQPVTRERMVIQVKSTADQKTVDNYAARLALHSADQMMLICHSPKGRLQAPEHGSGLQPLRLVLGEQVTELAMSAGLVDWIVGRSS